MPWRTTSRKEVEDSRRGGHRFIQRSVCLLFPTKLTQARRQIQVRSREIRIGTDCLACCCLRRYIVAFGIKADGELNLCLSCSRSSWVQPQGCINRQSCLGRSARIDQYVPLGQIA